MADIDVATPSAEYQSASQAWQLPRTLMGGTAAMRKAAQVYLPQEPAESPAAYAIRLQRSTLFNAFRKTVRDMTGKVFQKPVTLENDVPASIKEWSENIDLAGRHINVFARDVFYDAMPTGISFIHADMQAPLARGTGRNGEVTVADERAAGLRPYLCHVKAEDLIGWKSQLINGVATLTQVRIRETTTIPAGAFHDRTIEQIRVLLPGAWEIWRVAEDGPNKGQWFLFSAGITSVPRITIAPVYVNRTGFMTGAPPLEDLADLNVAHWQSQSDQRNILHVARVPILHGAGFIQDEDLVIGAGNMVRSSDPASKLAWVEHSGAAIGAGRDDLKDLEFQMQVQGLQLLVPNPGQTATGEIRDDAKENSPLAMMATALQDAIEMSFGFMAEYAGMGADAGGSVKVNKDFGVSLNGTDVQQLIDMVNSGQISRETFWSELQRRNFLSDSFDAESEAARIPDDPPTLGAMNG